MKTLITALALAGSLVLQGCKDLEIFKIEKKDYVEFYSSKIVYRDLGKDGILDMVYDFNEDSLLKITKISYIEQNITISDRKGNLLFKIEDNLTKFNEQAKIMQKNFDDIKEDYKKQQTK